MFQRPGGRGDSGGDGGGDGQHPGGGGGGEGGGALAWACVPSADSTSLREGTLPPCQRPILRSSLCMCSCV